jgi:SAM-dependent methyltransferase
MNDVWRPPKLNPREELVALLRGHAACPILSGLGEQGLLDRMALGPFSADDFPEVADQRLFAATLTYFVSLGLLRGLGGDTPRYEATKVGRTVFTRYGSCALIHSYRDYFERLAGSIVGTDRGPGPAVDRRVNVLGSGQLHARKFFPDAYRILADHPFRRLIDVGCGNGEFIAGVLKRRPEVQAVGVDLSEVAAAEVRARFGGRVPVVVADGADVSGWVGAFGPGRRPLVVSLWFVVHEFAAGSVERAVRFFCDLHARLPAADVILGEIVNLPAEVMAVAHVGSIMPEFLLFHALSGQGVFTWEQHQQVLREIPYTLAAEVRFDEMPDGADQTLPSSFLWHLRPLAA